MAARGAVQGGSLYYSPRLWASLLGMGAGRSIQAKFSPHASRAHDLMSGNTCLGSPKENGASSGGMEDLGPDCVSVKGGPFPTGVSTAGGEEAQRKSQERSRFWSQWQESSAGGRSGS